MKEKLNQSSEKRGFNLPHIFSWQIVVLLVAYALVLVYQLYQMASWGSFIGYDYEDSWNLSLITFVAGLIVSLVQFRFLQVKTRCITVLSFGESRKSLFRKKFWFPLGTMVLITIGFYIILLCTNKDLKEQFQILADEYFADMLIALLPLIVGYTVGAFARIMSGKTDEALALGASVCAFPFALFMVVDSVFALSLKGYYTIASVYLHFSNYAVTGSNTITTVLSIFDPLYTLNVSVYGFGTENIANGLWYEMPAFYIIKNLVWIFVLVVLVFAVEKHFVEKFKAECCDKSGKNKSVRTICSVTFGLVVVAFCMGGFYQSLSKDALPTISFSMLVASLIWASIMMLIFTALLYRKGIKLRYSFLGIAITCCLSVAFYVISVTGCFGYSTYIPDTQKIKAVMINDIADILPVDNSVYFYSGSESDAVDISFKDKEEIELVKNIHKFVAADKNYDISETFTIIYELENGELIYRTYPYLSDEGCEKISTLWETQTIRDYYRVILNQDENLKGSDYLAYWKSWEKRFAYNTNSRIINGSGYYDEFADGYYYESNCNRTIAGADSFVVYSKDGEPTCISNNKVSPEAMENLKKALYKDYMNMSAAQHYRPQHQIGVISLASCVTLLDEEADYWWGEEEKEELTAEEVLENNEGDLYRFPVTSDMVNTINVLKEMDFYKYFNSDLKISEAHLIDSQKLIKWMNSASVLDSAILTGLSNNNSYMSGLMFSWEDYNAYNYLINGCGYLDEDPNEYESLLSPISESDIEKITPEEAEKLREDAFMTYNAGNDCKFLVMKYTDGTANMLVIPN